MILNIYLFFNYFFQKFNKYYKFFILFKEKKYKFIKKK